MSRTRVHLTIVGFVQGVNFRAAARVEARRLGLTGWVRNRFDGSVETEAEGEPAAVEAFVAWCRQGPPAAEVEDVRVSPRSPTGLDRAFEVGTTG
jgi:acylphosphatase